jgi:hypothetical protein
MATRNIRPLHHKHRSSDCRNPALFRRHRYSKGKDLIVHRPNYKPWPLRWPFLASLLLILCSLIALTEYARHDLPVAKYTKGHVQFLQPNSSVPIQLPPTTKQYSTINARSTHNFRKAENMANTTSNLDTTRTPTPWVFKNATTPTVNRSFAHNATTSQTNASITLNQTAIPKNLYPVPSDYAGYNSIYGPTKYIVLRCKGDVDLVDRFVCEMALTENEGISCDRYTLWESDTLSDCQGQYIWMGPLPVQPWTEESLAGEGNWVLMFSCPSIPTCSQKWDCDSDTEIGQSSFGFILASTSFQIQKQTTTTSDLPVSEIDMVDIYTNNGHLITSLETKLIGGGVSTITTVAPFQVTAIGNPGGVVWELVESTSPLLESALDATDQGNILGQYTSTTTISSTSFLHDQPIPIQTEYILSSDPRRPGGLSGTISGTIVTLFNSDIVPTNTVAMESDILTDASGRPTTTLVDLFEELRDSESIPTGTTTLELDMLTDTSGRPTATILELVETLTDSNGLPIKTITATSNAFFEPSKTAPINSLETVINSNAMPIQTVTISFETLTGSSGEPTGTVEEFTASGTITAPPFPGSTGGTNGNLSNITGTPLLAVPIEPANYFMATFFPILITSLLSILIQILNKNVKLMLPFYALTRSNGALAIDSICVTPGGFSGPLHSIRLLFRFRQPISFLCDILVLLAAVLVSISSEAIGIYVIGICDLNSFKGCSMFFDVFDGPSRAVETLMIGLAIILGFVCVLLYPMRSGVAFNPWSIASTASLLSEDTVKLFQSFQREKQKSLEAGDITKRLEGINFALGSYFGSRGIIEYGIVSKPRAPCATPSSSTICSKTNRQRWTCGWFPKKFIMDYGVRVPFLMTLCGLLILILYYDTVKLNAATNSFEGFIDGQKFGVRSFFVGFGVIISFFWDDMFSSKLL